MEAPAPKAERPMSDAEESHVVASIDQFRRFVALTRAGAGGVAQLRRFYLEQIEDLERELKTRPRVRDFKPASKKAETPAT